MLGEAKGETVRVGKYKGDDSRMKRIMFAVRYNVVVWW